MKYIASNANPIARRHRSRERHAADDRGGTREIDDMVHVEAVARTLPIANARDRPVEAVAEPVCGQEHDE